MQRMTLTCCCFLAALTVATWTQSQAGATGAGKLADKLLLIDGAYLASVRGRVRAGDATLKPAVAALEEDAKKALAMKPTVGHGQDGHAAERRQARLHEPGAVLVARSGKARRPAVHPARRRAQSGDQPHHGSRQLRTLDERRLDARSRVYLDRPRRVRRAGGASRARLVSRSRDADEPAPELRPGHSRHHRRPRHRHHRDPRSCRTCSTACG